MARTTKNTKENKEKMQKKVDDLLADIDGLKKIKGTAESTDKLKEATKEKVGNWLEEQVNELTKTNERLEKELAKKNDDYAKLYDVYQQAKLNAPASDEDLKNGVVKIFKDLESNYLGLNQVRTRYHQADVKTLLDKFLRTFPFLMKIKQPIR